MKKAAKIKVLYIDDEMHNLMSFKATFRHDYVVLTAISADEGLALLRQHPDIQLILSDHRMPEKTGVQFFKEIAEEFPDPVRMLVTGYVDIESVISAINDGHVYRYLSKPWREEEIRGAIQEGYQYYTASTLLKLKNKELEEANYELDKFTYSVTHDIKGPLVSILGAAEILEGMEDVEEIHKLAGMMKQSAEKVRDLVNNIHSYYSRKRGNVNVMEVQFEQLLRETVEMYQIQAAMEGVDIHLHVDQQEPFQTDEAAVQLIVNNLLSNAIKYTNKDRPKPMIKIEVKTDGDTAYLTVEDNGIGIQPEFSDKIFEMFYRATHQSLGSGFGLFNVKDALTKLKGTIEVESEYGVGTKFIVTIPSQ